MIAGNIRERVGTFRSGLVWAGTVSVVLFLILGIALIGLTGNKASGAAPQSQLLGSTSLPAASGQTIFEQKCQACHSIGGGRLVGPDLAGVTSRRDRDWLISFITAPDQLIAQGDSLANQLVQEYGLEMPNLGLSEQEAAEALAYIESQSGDQPVPTHTEEQPTLLTTTGTPGDAAQGRDIFTGSMPLKNGGAACISCHNVNGIAALGGGAVAKDLTESYSNLGEAGLTSVLKTTPFPLMKVIYEVRPLEDDEVADLVAFLGETADIQQPTAGQSPLAFIMIGIAGLLLILIIIKTIWRGRLSGVRQSLVKGGSK